MSQYLWIVKGKMMSTNSFQLQFLLKLFCCCLMAIKAQRHGSCEMAGRCPENMIIADNEVANVDDCLNLCFQYQGCKHFTFNRVNGLCELFNKCPKVDEYVCSECVTLNIELCYPTTTTTTTTTTYTTYTTTIITSRKAESSTTTATTTAATSTTTSKKFEKENCSLPGECRDGFLLNGTFATSEFECHSLCKFNSVGCSWYTFFPKLKYCQLFKNCSSIDISQFEESKCVTGHVSCMPAKCWITGQCQGNVLKLMATSLKEQCLQRCRDYPQCNWFTFDGSNSVCTLFKNCQVLDERHVKCLSGERECTIDIPDAKTSNTTSSSTTTSTQTTATTTTTTSKGFVALILRKNYASFNDEVKLYSPGGKCSQTLAKFPTNDLDSIFLGIVKNEIVACGRLKEDQACWNYNITRNAWSLNEVLTISNKSRITSVIFHQDKLYNFEGSGRNIYYPKSKTLRKWNHRKLFINEIGCSLEYGHRLYVLICKQSQGGDSESPVRFSLHRGLGMPNNKILFIGFGRGLLKKAVLIFDQETNEFKMVGYSMFVHSSSNLVRLGNRIFAIGKSGVEEYDWGNNTWTIIDQGPTWMVRSSEGHALLALPAELFSHLPSGCTGVD